MLDLEHPVSIGSYMNEPDTLNNKYQLHLAMEQARRVIPQVLEDYEALSGRKYPLAEGYRNEDAEVILFLLGSSYHTDKTAADRMREEGIRAGVVTLHDLRPFPAKELYELCRSAVTVLAADRQDSYGAGGGNMTLELKAALKDHNSKARVLSRVYGLGGRDFYVQDALELFRQCLDGQAAAFDYLGVYPGEEDLQVQQYFAPISKEDASPGYISSRMEENGTIKVTGGRVNESTAMPKRLAPGHGACPRCV